MYVGQWTNCYAIVIFLVILFMESTTWFVSGRWLLFEHGVSGGSILQTINSAMLFLTFIVCRVGFETYVIAMSGIPYLFAVYVNGEISTTLAYRVLFAFMTTSLLITYALNWYWLGLIIRQLVRILKRGADKAETSYTGAEPQPLSQSEESKPKDLMLSPSLRDTADPETVSLMRDQAAC